jgi:pseudouridine synthase
MRINRFVALSTKYSRRHADDLIKAGHVKVNGVTTYNLGTRVTPGLDEVCLHGTKVSPRTHVYYALNKPRGYTTTVFDPFAQKKVIDLVPRSPSVHPVGRLDRDSEGLIILTNDGEFTHLITHPRHFIEKEYYVEARPRFDNWTVSRLKEMTRGMNLTEYTTKPAQVHGWRHIASRVSFYIIIKEGHKRQIRYMCQKIGLNVLILRRVRVGRLRLSNLPAGEYKIIKPEDVISA